MTSRGGSRAAARISGALTAITGAAFLVWPRQLASRAAGSGDIPNATVVRILGGRQLLQGAALLMWPRPNLLLVGGITDTLHAASMVAAPLIWPNYRRPALVSATIAGVSAALNGAIFVKSSTPRNFNI